jgi:hypothetical protein
MVAGSIPNLENPFNPHCSRRLLLLLLAALCTLSRRPSVCARVHVMKLGRLAPPATRALKMLRRFFIESGRRSPAAVACAAAVAGGAAAVIGAPSWCSDGGCGRRALSFGWGCPPCGGLG